MKIKTLLVAGTVGGMLTICSFANAQTTADSGAVANVRTEEVDATARSKSEMKDLKRARKDAKQQLKEANRVKSDAKDAMKASKRAYKSEKRAQKARKKAEKDHKKAESAIRETRKN